MPEVAVSVNKVQPSHLYTHSSSPENSGSVISQDERNFRKEITFEYLIVMHF